MYLKKLRFNLQHFFNPLNIYCKFIDCKIKKRTSLNLSKLYEKFMFKFIKKFITTKQFKVKKLRKNTKKLKESLYVGTIWITYFQLVEIFGKPTIIYKEKHFSQCEWFLKINNLPLRIYNWKSGKNFLGEDGKNNDEIIVWDIGSSNKYARLIIVKYIEYKGGKWSSSL